MRRFPLYLPAFMADRFEPAVELNIGKGGNVLQITEYMVKIIAGPDIQLPGVGYKNGNI